MNRTGNRDHVRRFCFERGAVSFGVAALDSIRTDDFLLPASMLGQLPTGISLALRVSKTVLATLEHHPNRLYEHHYRQVNFALDRLSLALADEIHRLGFQALPIPASQIVDWERQRAHLSHKRVAVAAGLGWLGRSNLLVTPDYGAQVRLATVLTDLPLEPDAPLDRDCGACRDCIDACPANAIRAKQSEFDHLACFEMLKEFQRRRYVGQYICGLCVRACSGPASGCSGNPDPPKDGN